MAQGWTTLVAATVLLLGVLTATAFAQQPIDPLGPQLRLTQEGADGDPAIDAGAEDVAYNSVRNEFLVVFERRFGAETEIFGRRLAANGSPIGSSFQISGVAADPAGYRSSDPAVAYDPERDRYGVVFARDDTVQFENEIFVQLVRGDGALVAFNGTPGAAPRVASNIGNNDSATQVASSPDVAYRPDVDAVASTPDAWIVTYDGDEVDNEFNIFASGLQAETGFVLSGFDRDVSAMGATGDAFDPSITVVPGGEDLAIAFEAFNGVQTQVFARRLPGTLPDSGSQTQITDATLFAQDPAITANTAAGQLLVAYAGQEAASDNEIFAQRLDLGLGQIGTNDQQVSSAGPPGTAGPPFFSVTVPDVSYNPKIDRYLVTWIGQDVGRPGLSDDEREVTGTGLTAGGTEVEPQDFTISRMGADNDDSATPLDDAVAANPATGRWLAVWASDDPRPPLADGEFELYGRQVGENFDRDGDGSPVPVDCNDANAGIRPGAPDVPDNGVDEDCSGADAINLDRDGDGSLRPADCDDANPAIAPGKTDIANNDVDEDCSGSARRALTGAAIERFFRVFRGFTKVTKLRVTKVKPGMKVRLRCTPRKRKGCPRKLRGKGRTFTIKKPGAKKLTKLIRKAKLKPGATLEVRILEDGAIGRLDKFKIRKSKLPKRKQRCIPFGTTKSQKSCSTG